MTFREIVGWWASGLVGIGDWGSCPLAAYRCPIIADFGLYSHKQEGGARLRRAGATAQRVRAG